jgi:predicted  nucleic acid-binding Zn-ribbon protein
MGPAELLLHHSRLDERARTIAADIERLEARLASNPEAERLERELAEAKALQQEVALKLRDRDREREDHRSKMRARERELMSGRIHNPTELMQMSEEVNHMKARLATEEDEELELMEQSERADGDVRRLERDLAQARSAAEAESPELRARVDREREQLGSVERERDEVWAQVPADFQAAARRLRVRPSVVEVVSGQCSACRVQVTSRQMQVLRRGDQLVQCENCGRILVVA